MSKRELLDKTAMEEAEARLMAVFRREEVKETSEKMVQQEVKTPKKVEKAERFTLYITPSIIAKLRGASYFTGKSMKDITNEALEEWFKNYEEKEGDIILPR